LLSSKKKEEEEDDDDDDGAVVVDWIWHVVLGHMEMYSASVVQKCGQCNSSKKLSSWSTYWRHLPCHSLWH
jgi:hypothetical protein